MTSESNLLTSLVFADDAEFFELLRGVEKSDCNRCKSNDRVRKGSIAGSRQDRRQEMRCECGWTWSVPLDGGGMS
jgi:transposase-like protein